MSDDAFIGPRENPYESGHLPVSGEYTSRSAFYDDASSDVDGHYDASNLDDITIRSVE